MRADRERRPQRAALLALAVVVALALVALASRGHAPAGDGGGHGRSIDTSLFFEYVVLLTMAVALIVVPFIAQSFWTVRSTGQLPQRKRRFGRGFRTLAVLLVVTIGLVTVRLVWGGSSGRLRGLFGNGGSGSGAPGARDRTAGKPLAFDWAPVIVVGSLFLVGLVIAILYLRHTRAERSRSPEALAAELSDVLDDTLDDLRAEPDARRAVIAAYSRMERALAWFGVPRRVYEAPLEYLARVLVELRASAESVKRLTDLFERAKFSRHEIGPSLRDDAIEALVTVRDELRSYR